MKLLDLPYELILVIWDTLKVERDYKKFREMFAFSSTCRYLYNSLSPLFYQEVVWGDQGICLTAMRWAVNREQKSTIPMQKLLEAGAHRPYSIYKAIQSQNLDILKFLLRSEFDPQKNGHLLAMAARYECPEIVQAILEAGVRVDTFGLGSKSALTIALDEGNDNVVNVLLDWRRRLGKEQRVLTSRVRRSTKAISVT